MDDLPTQFDVIVVGTGFTESLVAAAASRNGKSVLHLDPNEFYGGTWASFNLKQISNLAEPKCNFNSHITNVQDKWFDFEKYGQVHGYDKEKILTEFRRFNIDLMPTVLFSCGSLVELLVSSNISRYAEFRAVDRIATLINEKVITVPCSRADVFNNRDLNVVEKRILMKFMQTCLTATTDNSELLAANEGKTFKEFMQAEKLTAKLVHFVLHSIAMADERTEFAEGVSNVNKFLKSLGRYGNTSFLYPMYGCGELPQCFCRLCAVFGGIYCLNQKIEKVTFSETSDFSGIQWGERHTSAKHLVIGPHVAVSLENLFESASEEFTKSPTCGELSRGILITASPLGGASQNTGGGGVAFMNLPPLPGKEHKGVHVFQLSHFSGTCPKGLYLIHMVCEAIETPETDLQPYIDQFLKSTAPPAEPTVDVTVETSEPPEIPQEETIPTILWSFYFKIPKCCKCDRESTGQHLKSGIRICCGPDFALDYDHPIAQAKAIYDKMYPGEEFLPRAPDPEEIIFGDEDSKDNVDLEAPAKQDDGETASELDKSIESDVVD